MTILKSQRSLPDSKVAARQRFLNKWYHAFALAPFAILIFIDFKFFPNSNNPVLVALVFLSLLWAMGIAGYAFCLLNLVQMSELRTAPKNLPSSSLEPHSESSYRS